MFIVLQSHYTLLQRVSKTILILLFSFNLMAGADEVGNGAGLYENLVAKVWMELPETLDNFITSSSDELGKREVFQIKNNLNDITLLTKIIFLPESEIFFLDNEYRLALTYNRVGADILFNLDKLYKINPTQILEVLTATLVHELLHQIGVRDHFYADKIGQRVSRYLTIDKSIFYTNQPFSNEHIIVVNFSKGASKLYFVNQEKVREIDIYKKSECDDYMIFNLYKVENLIKGKVLERCEQKSLAEDVTIIKEE